jgi:hypothetical protein
MYHGKTPAGAQHLYYFGRMAVAKSTAKIQEILDNKGFPAIYYGPSEDHKRDTYTFWNPKTKHSIESQSAVFLQKNYGDFHKLNKL